MKPEAALTTPVVDGWRDLVWAILFYVHLIATAVLFVVSLVIVIKVFAPSFLNHMFLTFLPSKDENQGTTAPPGTTSAPPSNRFPDTDTSKSDLTKVVVILALTGVASAVLSGVWMLVMKTFPKQLIYIAFVFTILMYLAISITSFAFGQVCSFKDVIVVVLCDVHMAFVWIDLVRSDVCHHGCIDGVVLFHLEISHSVRQGDAQVLH